MNARHRILAKLRNALPVENDMQAAPAVAGYYAANTLAPQTCQERVAQLRGLLQAAHAEVIVASRAAWVSLLAVRLAALGVGRLALNEDTEEGRQLAATLRESSGSVTLLPFDKPIETWKQELFDTVDAGFTVADSAIAATGTLVFKSSPAQPRSLSLVPPLHVALVRAETIHAHMFAAALEEQWAAAMPTNLVMVSGPSKTSDIQQTLAYGAHGPKQMLVVIVSGEGESA
ncbi:MAG: lactate utilization protein C [Rhodocyclaceae bacterium]|nr:MAG: lactate utilization protein C [Rhodocyclaceae bacterium]